VGPRLLLLLVLALVVPAQADAAVTRKKAIWGPVSVDGRSQFPIYADLGVGIYQSTLRWDADERRMRVAERVTFAPAPEAQAPAAPDAPAPAG